MKITFLIPPAISEKAPDRSFGCNYGITFQQPTHILYSAAVLEKEGHEVKFIDCPVEGIKPDEFIRFLLNDDSIVYCMFTVYLAEQTDIHAASVIRGIKTKQQKTVYIIFFGPEPTRRPEFYIKDEHTFVVRGEPEYTMKELVEAFEGKCHLNKVNGISYIENLKLRHNQPRPLIENLDELPFPARHLIKHPEKYENAKLKNRPCTTMMTSRGCWGRCTYCIPCAYSFCREIEFKKYHNMKPLQRLRSPNNIYEEFKQIKEQGFKSVAIMDDNFMGFNNTQGRERIIELCQLLEPLGIEWGCLARADNLQYEEVLRWLKRAGCAYVDIGVESFSQNILNDVGKGLKVGDVYDAIFLLKKISIEPKINILLGCSSLQTEGDIKWTVEVLKTLKVGPVSFGIVTPHPSTEYYKTIKEHEWFTNPEGDWRGVDPYKEAEINLPNLNKKKLEELVSWCYKEYYLRLSYILQVMSHIESFGEFLGKTKIAWRLFR